MQRDNDANLIEEKISSEDIFDGVLLHVKKDQVRLPNGDITVREWIKHPGAASVLPITKENKVILVRQYRYPVGMVTLEIPAGKLDKGEDPLECAKRELGEETGYTAQNYRYLTKLATTVGFSDELIYLYLATDLAKGEQHTDEDEFINVVELSFKEAWEKIYSGEIIDGKSIVSILMAKELLGIEV